MNVITGEIRVLWTGVKWAGAPTIGGVRELSKILGFLAGIMCVLRSDKLLNTRFHRDLFFVLFVLVAVNPVEALAGDVFPGTVITGTSGSLTASNSAATSEAGEPTTYGGGAVNSMWYSWTAPSAGTLIVQTCSATLTTFDTTLQTFTGSTVGGLTTVATNDDACAHTTGTYASLNTVAVTSGSTYRIQVDGYGNATGNFLLSWNFTPAGSGGDNFPGNTISGLSGSVTNTNVGATGESGEPTTYGGGALNTIWYSWTAPGTGPVTFDTCSISLTNFDTTLVGYTGGAVNALTTVATNDDACNASIGFRASSITFSAMAGTTYRIQIDGYASNTGNFVLNWVQSAPAASITKVADLSSIAGLSTITYTITVDNTGTADLASPSLTDSLTQNGSSRTLTSGPALTSGDTDSDNVLDTTETWIYTATYAVSQVDLDDANDLINSATFNATGISAISDSATTTVTAAPSLSVTKIADDTTNVTVGQLITYTYTITNDGNQTISNISLADVHGGSGTAPAPDADSATLTDNGTPGDSTNPTTGDGDWDTLAPGDVLSVTATYTITQTDVDTQQ